ncbi:MAG: DICT sensory domain-containing protein [Nocardioidaceae bacterium]
MTTNVGDAQEPGPGPSASLTIGQLARRTGLSTAVLRAWESRYGFPVPKRLASGHRRYDDRDVALVDDVLRRRDAGVRLEVAVSDAAAENRSGTESVYAELRRREPALAPQTLRKATLLALTRAFEDECCARAQRPLLFGGFQHARFLRQARARWEDLGATARHTVVFGALDDRSDVAITVDRAASTVVHLPAAAPLRREWFLVCDAPDYPACLAAWELPGQTGTRDRDRLFETVWTLEPRAVREAARSCARLAADLLEGSTSPVGGLVDDQPEPPAASPDLVHATATFSRMLGYLDAGRR